MCLLLAGEEEQGPGGVEVSRRGDGQAAGAGNQRENEAEKQRCSELDFKQGNTQFISGERLKEFEVTHYWQLALLWLI